MFEKFREFDNDLANEIIEAINDVVNGDGGGWDNSDYDCVDNYRASRVKDGLFNEEWQAAFDGGCCGFYDGVYIDSHGDEWEIGFNYGH